MPSRQPRRKAQQEPTSATPQHTRIEMRWLTDARELKDLSQLAEQMKGNPAKRAEAGAYVIHLWSRVLHGELSPGAFWELFGVPLPPPVSLYSPMPMPGMYPGMVPPSAPVEQPASPPAEDPEAIARKQKRVRNRQAVADEYV
jgi:hypothetical protein